MDSNEKMWSVKEVAFVLGVSRDSISRLIRRGELKAVRLPRMGGRGANILENYAQMVEEQDPIL